MRCFLIRCFVLMFCIVNSLAIFSQKQNNPELNSLIYRGSSVWSYVKIHSVRKTDWEKQYRKIYKKALIADSFENYDLFLKKWIKKYYRKPDFPNLNSFQVGVKKEPDFSLKLQFNEFEEAKIKKNSSLYTTDSLVPFYFSETYLNSDVCPDEPMRLMTLSKIWYSFRYFYPYYDENIKSWDSLFFANISIFKNSDSKISYHLAVRNLIATIPDGHVSVNSSFIQNYFFKFHAPFRAQIQDSFAVITVVDKSSYAQNSGLTISDTIFKINDLWIHECLSFWKDKIPYSNHANFLNLVEENLFSDSIPQMILTLKKGDAFQKRSIKLFQKGEFVLNYDSIPYKIIYDSVGWIDLGILKMSDMNSLKHDFENIKFVCIDARNYPNATVDVLCEWLLPESKPFVVFSKPDKANLGKFYVQDTVYSSFNKSMERPKNIILISNAKSVSQTEYTILALKTGKNVIHIGEPTGGTAGYTMLFYLPDGISIRMPVTGFSGISQKVQGKGIQPDVFIKIPLFFGQNKEEQTWNFISRYFYY